MALLGLSSNSPLTLNTAANFGVFQLTLGLAGIVRPQILLTIWEIRTSTLATKEQTIVETLIQLYGLRNVALGLMILAVRNKADSKTLGWVVMSDLIVVLGDGFLQRKVTGSGGWKHWSFMPVGVGLSMLLRRLDICEHRCWSFRARREPTGSQ